MPHPTIGFASCCAPCCWSDSVLKVHHERRELAVYLLTVMKNGPKFRESITEGPAVFREEKNRLVAERASLSDLAMQIS